MDLKLTHGTSQYRVGALVAETDAYRLYICNDVPSGKQYLLQIATRLEHNGGLEKASFLLSELKQLSDSLETEYAKLNPGKLLSYDRLIPARVDSFVATDQGNRRVNILAFAEVEGVESMVPLSNLVSRDHLRIALPSSAWVMGRLLKLLAFVHANGIAVRALAGNNILLEPSRHFVVVFDWSSALMSQAKVPVDLRESDIVAAAQAVFASIGGNSKTGEYAYDDGDDADHHYVTYLRGLLNGRESNAERAHEDFYELVDRLWGRSFRPFQTSSL